MAAVITLSSPTVAADGKTITATIGGGSGTYSITNATGINPHLTNGNAQGFYVTAVSVLSTTLTITIATPIGSGEAVRLDIASSSNLTDTSANTPTGQTNVTMTNNSAVTVTTVTPATAVDMAKFDIDGFVTVSSQLRRDQQKQSWAIQSITNRNGGQAWIEFVTDATEVAVLTYSGDTTAAWVDGAASATTLDNTNGFWAAKAVTTSPLAAGKHLIQFTTAGYFHGVRLSGGTRTIYTVPKTRALAQSVTAGTYNMAATTPVKLWGNYATDTATGTAAFGQSYTGTELVVQFTGTHLEVGTVASNSSQFSVQIDGGAWSDPLNDAATYSSQHNQFSYQKVAENLAYGTHTVRLMFIGSGTNTTWQGVRASVGTYLSSASSVGASSISVPSVTYISVNDWVRIDRLDKAEWRQVTAISGSGPYTLTLGGSTLATAHASGAWVTSFEAPAATITSWVPTDRSWRKICGFGDSNTQGANEYGFASTACPDGYIPSQYDPRQSPFGKTMDIYPWEVVNLGIAGTDTTNQAGRVADFATRGRSNFDLIFCWLGTNDINTTVSPATFATNLATIVTSARAALRAGGKVILVPPRTPTTTNAQGLNIAACKAAMVTAAAGKDNVMVWDISQSIVAADIDGTVHYKDSGRIKVAAELRAIASWAGPATGFAA